MTYPAIDPAAIDLPPTEPIDITYYLPEQRGQSAHRTVEGETAR